MRNNLSIKVLNYKDLKITIKDYLEGALFHNSFSIFLRKVGRFILRLIRWVPVLWNQEEWDYEYMYDVLVMKMKELRKNMSEDCWHDSKEVQKRIKQIDICLRRLDMHRNWTKYYYYPMEDIYYEPTEDGCFRVCHASERNEKQRLGAIHFEEKNFKKFWKDFVQWHQGWWT